MPYKFFLRKKPPGLTKRIETTNSDEEFSKAISLFKEQREKNAISLEDLAKKTKISRNVLVAIENGWKTYLPEETYLNSMIKRLESELILEKGSLDGLLTPKINFKQQSKLKILNINFLQRWEGSLLYFLLMLISILALNSQQKYLLHINSLSTEPIFLIKETNKEIENGIYNIEVN